MKQMVEKTYALFLTITSWFIESLEALPQVVMPSASTMNIFYSIHQPFEQWEMYVKNEAVLAWRLL